MRIRFLAMIVGVLTALLMRAQVAAGGVYYVAVDGADENPGTDLLPWQTIGHAATQAQAGDLVVVQPGTYREAVLLTRSGAAGTPIVFRGLPGAVMVSPDPTQSRSAFDVGTDVSYVTLQGFELGGGFAETVFVRSGAHDVELAGLHIHDNHSGIWISGASDVVVRDTVLDHNFRTGIRIFGGAHRVHVVDTRSEANDDGLGCDGESDGFNADDSTADIVFERVSAVGNSQDGFDLQAPSIALQQAIAQDNGCSGVKLAAGGSIENALVERNRTGINISGLPYATTVLQNCTVSQNDLGVRAIGAGYSVVLRNSIITGPAKALSYAAGVELIEHHNIFYRPVLSDRLIVRMEENGETLFSAADVNDGAWQTASGQGQDTVAADPGFEAGGCEPRSDSIAVDSGDPSTSPPIDLVGTMRPEGNGVDRGAFERVTQSPRLRLRHLVLHSGRSGTGLARLGADVSVPGRLSFDPLVDSVRVSIRGSRGDVVRVMLSPSTRSRSASGGSGWFVWRRADQLDRAKEVRLGTYQDRVRLWLSASDANVWAVDGTQASVVIELGRLRATMEPPFRTVAHAIVLP